MSIGQLLESALEVAGQVAGTSASTSPLSYSTMAGQCEALETGTRKKLSNWLAQESSSCGDAIARPSDGSTVHMPASSPRADDTNGEMGPNDQFSALKLPPASPFDNFINAVSGPRPILAGLSP
ncbi:Nuclear receptor subfamily 6 group A member 1 [Bienertia sinuspersici]